MCLSRHLPLLNTTALSFILVSSLVGQNIPTPVDDVKGAPFTVLPVPLFNINFLLTTQHWVHEITQHTPMTTYLGIDDVLYCVVLCLLDDAQMFGSLSRD